MKTFKKITFIILGVFTLLWIAMIYFLSSQDGGQTAKLSMIVTKFAKMLLNRDVNHISNHAHAMVRSMAHVVLFFGLGGISYLFLYDGIFANQLKWRGTISTFLSLIVTCGCGYFDEWRKQFVEGRHFQMKEVSLNIACGLAGILLIGAIRVLIQFIYQMVVKRKFARSSLKIDIPGYKELFVDTLLLDYNGTIAINGKIPQSVKERLILLSQKYEIYVLTADTHGTAEKQCRGLGVKLHTFPVGNAVEHKLKIVKQIGGDHCACLGNGRNDILMFKKCELSVAICDHEGMYGKLLEDADLCVNSIEDGLDLFIYPKRLIADLRG